MFKSSKTLLALSALLAVLAIMLVGCYEKAQPSSQAKTETKSSLAAPAKTTAPAEVNAPVCKTAVKKECKTEKKVCPKKAAKKACPLNCKKPCCAKKMVKCVSDANAAAKSCEKRTCAVGDGKAVNENICAEYKGKKYCFCCQGCKKQFEKDPEKCINKCK
ncbi:MAG: YHS domain-containing protein [Phycisphaerae bacterium]|nr:YHS domain-containing protein [Phycisphaerae bacterium]